MRMRRISVAVRSLSLLFLRPFGASLQSHSRPTAYAEAVIFRRFAAAIYMRLHPQLYHRGAAAAFVLRRLGHRLYVGMLL